MDYLECKSLYHSGVKGMKWGIRNFRDENGKLTPEGIRKYQQSRDAYMKSEYMKSKFDADLKAKELENKEASQDIRNEEIKKLRRNHALKIAGVAAISVALGVAKGIRKNKNTRDMYGANSTKETKMKAIGRIAVKGLIAGRIGVMLFGKDIFKKTERRINKLEKDNTKELNRK